MKPVSTFACLCLLTLTLACSDEEKTAGPEAPPPIDRRADRQNQAGHSVVPVKLSPEDQILADQAPDGMVFIKGGCFVMGNDATQADEKPEHEVCLDDFYLGKYEVTQAEYVAVTGLANPSNFVGDTNRPVEQVSWLDWDRELSRFGLLLPTEAQWEYAARGGTPTPWSSGAEILSLEGVANVADAYAKQNGGPSSWTFEEELDDGFTMHAPVGSFLDNPMGLFDVHGNVWEWCRDWSEKYHLQVRHGDGYRIVPRAKRRERVARGGDFSALADDARSANRGAAAPETKDRAIGVRPSRAISSR